MSAISDYCQQPRWQQMPGLGGFVQPQPVYLQDPEVKEMLKRLIELADKIDKKLGDVECNDESKLAFRQELGLD